MEKAGFFKWVLRGGGLWFCALFAGMVVVLTGCPTGAEELPSAGNDYIAEAVLLNEREKYQTAVVLSFEAGDAGTDVTARFMQLSPGKTADSGVSVSILGTSGNGFFALQDGMLTFTGSMPPEEPYGEKNVEPVPEPQAGGGSETPSEDPATVGASVIPNGEVVTLLFQKDGASDTLEVLGIIEKKGTEKDDARVATNSYDTYLLYGVDVLNSAYINRNAVKRSRPILDGGKVNVLGALAESQPVTISPILQTAVAESVSGVFESINGPLSTTLGDKATLFAGNATSEFATGNAAVPTRYFAKIRQVHPIRKESLLAAIYMSRALLSQDFIVDVNAMSTSAFGSAKTNPKYIIDTYGTHLIAGYYSGGTAELNYSYTGTSLTTQESITNALNNVVAAASTGTTMNAAAKELSANSSFTSSTRGGNSTSWATATQFADGYGGWRNSIAASPDICAIPNPNVDLIPIWEIVSLLDTAKARLVQEYFNTLVAARKQVIQSYKATDVPFVTGISAKTGALLAGISGYPYTVKADMYSDKGDPLNANAGVSILISSSDVHIAYKTENQTPNHNAVAEIEIATSTSSTPPLRQGWTTVPIDLNYAVSGPYLWLQYRTVTANDTQAIDFIGSYCADTAGDGQILGGYSWVSWQGSPGARADLNQGVAGKRIYLTVHKAPFKW